MGSWLMKNYPWLNKKLQLKTQYFFVEDWTAEEDVGHDNDEVVEDEFCLWLVMMTLSAAVVVAAGTVDLA